MKFIIILLALLIIQISLLVCIIAFSCSKLCKKLDDVFYLLYGCIDNGNCALDQISDVFNRFERDRKEKELPKDDLPWP